MLDEQPLELSAGTLEKQRQQSMRISVLLLVVWVDGFCEERKSKQDGFWCMTVQGQLWGQYSCLIFLENYF